MIFIFFILISNLLRKINMKNPTVVRLSKLILIIFKFYKQYLATEASSGSVVILLVEFLPSLTITLLNVIIPLLFEVLVKAEDYTEEFVIKITLVR